VIAREEELIDKGTVVEHREMEVEVEA